jgi:hypothetical protein
MFIPEPVFGLVLAYITDGEPVRRILRGSRPAPAGWEWPGWSGARRLMDMVVYQIVREMITERRPGCILIIIPLDCPELEVARALRNAMFSRPMPTAPLKLSSYDTLYWDYGDAPIIAHFGRGGFYSYDLSRFDAVFIYHDGFPANSTNAAARARVHDGVKTFVI